MDKKSQSAHDDRVAAETEVAVSRERARTLTQPAVLGIALSIGCVRPSPPVEATLQRVEVRLQRVPGIAHSRGTFADYYRLAHPAGDEGLLPLRAKFLLVREKGGCALVVA